MSSLVYLIPLALLLGGTALAAFLWSLRSGQYEDLDGAAQRIFLEEGRERAGAGGGPTLSRNQNDVDVPSQEKPVARRNASAD